MARCRRTQPKGVIDAKVLADNAKSETSCAVEAESRFDGITILGVAAQGEGDASGRIELLGSSSRFRQ